MCRCTLFLAEVAVGCVNHPQLDTWKQYNRLNGGRCGQLGGRDGAPPAFSPHQALPNGAWTQMRNRASEGRGRGNAPGLHGARAAWYFRQKGHKKGHVPVFPREWLWWPRPASIR